MKTILLSCLMLASVSTFAQRFQLGIKGGTNISNFTGGNLDNTEHNALVGYHVGGFVGFYLGNNFSIQPEVVYSTQGAKIKDLTTQEKQNFKLNYLNVPVLAKYEFNGGFFLETGPQVGFNVGSSKFQNQRVKDITKSSDFSWAAGLGYHAPFGLGIDARYNVGLSKVSDISFDNPDYKNSVIQIGLFYTLFNNHIHEK